MLLYMNFAYEIIALRHLKNVLLWESIANNAVNHGQQGLQPFGKRQGN